MGSSGENGTNSFYIDLLSNIEGMNEYPFTKLVIKNHLNKKEYEDSIQLLNTLEKVYFDQKEEGLLNYNSLLIKFVGALNSKMDPIEALYALKKEGSYSSLISVLISTHEDELKGKD